MQNLSFHNTNTMVQEQKTNNQVPIEGSEHLKKHKLKLGYKALYIVYQYTVMIRLSRHICVLGRYFPTNEFSGLLNRPYARTIASVPALFVRTSEISGPSETQINEYHCTMIGSILWGTNFGCLKTDVLSVLTEK